MKPTDIHEDTHMNTQTRAQRAFSKLQSIGAPVFNLGTERGTLFTLSAEHNTYGELDMETLELLEEGDIWADYYGEYSTGYPEVSPKVTAILEHYGLGHEWNDAGTVHIFDNQYTGAR
jgi:hypothetical protein